MHSKAMYLGLQNTRILVGFLRVAAANWAKSVHALARGWRHGKRDLVECQESRDYCACSGLVHVVGWCMESAGSAYRLAHQEASKQYSQAQRVSYLSGH